jgi:hypothetical protein
MEKHYIRIDINGEPGKLPEKEGIYIVFVKDEASIVQWKYAPFPEDKKDWLENIDWYLQPVTSNADEIVKKQDELIEYLKDYYDACVSPLMIDNVLLNLESELKELRK